MRNKTGSTAPKMGERETRRVSQLLVPTIITPKPSPLFPAVQPVHMTSDPSVRLVHPVCFLRRSGQSWERSSMVFQYFFRRYGYLIIFLRYHLVSLKLSFLRYSRMPPVPHVMVTLSFSLLVFLFTTPSSISVISYLPIARPCC